VSAQELEEALKITDLLENMGQRVTLSAESGINYFNAE